MNTLHTLMRKTKTAGEDGDCMRERRRVARAHTHTRAHTRARTHTRAHTHARAHTPCTLLFVAKRCQQSPGSRGGQLLLAAARRVTGTGRKIVACARPVTRCTATLTPRPPSSPSPSVPLCGDAFGGEGSCRNHIE